MTLSGLGLLTMWELPRRVNYFESNFLQNYFSWFFQDFPFISCHQIFISLWSFYTQHSDFSSFLAVSTTDKPCLCSHVAERSCVKGVYLSWYSLKNKEGVWAIRAIKYKNYVAGKYTRAPAPFARKYTNLNSDTVPSDSTPENFANIWQIKWNWIRSMKFETVQIYFLSEFSVCCHPNILLLWQRDVTTSPLYSLPRQNNVSSSLFSFKNRDKTYLLEGAYEQAGCGLGRYVDVSYYCITALHLISISF